MLVPAAGAGRRAAALAVARAPPLDGVSDRHRCQRESARTLAAGRDSALAGANGASASSGSRPASAASRSAAALDAALRLPVKVLILQRAHRTGEAAAEATLPWPAADRADGLYGEVPCCAGVKEVLLAARATRRL